MAAAAQADFVQALTICGLNPIQRNLLVSQGIETIDDLKTLTQDEIKSMCSNIRKNTPVHVPIAGGDGVGGRGVAVAAEVADLWALLLS